MANSRQSSTWRPNSNQTASSPSYSKTLKVRRGKPKRIQETRTLNLMPFQRKAIFSPTYQNYLRNVHSLLLKNQVGITLRRMTPHSRLNPTRYKFKQPFSSEANDSQTILIVFLDQFATRCYSHKQIRWPFTNRFASPAFGHNSNQISTCSKRSSRETKSAFKICPRMPESV